MVKVVRAMHQCYDPYLFRDHGFICRTRCVKLQRANFAKPEAEFFRASGSGGHARGAPASLSVHMQGRREKFQYGPGGGGGGAQIYNILCMLVGFHSHSP